MEDFYIVITTMRTYKVALEILLSSLPVSTKYILVYSNEQKNDFKVNTEGNIEVSIINNIYEYGAYLGVNLLLENKIISNKSIFLFIHDTCNFGSKASSKIPPLVSDFRNEPQEIFWLSHKGQCNICLIKSKAVLEGAKIYKDYLVMDKMMAIAAEWNGNKLSAKKIPVEQKMSNLTAEPRGQKDVYKNNIKRHVIYYSLIDLEKNYVAIKNTSEHPQKP